MCPYVSVHVCVCLCPRVSVCKFECTRLCARVVRGYLALQLRRRLFLCFSPESGDRHKDTKHHPVPRPAGCWLSWRAVGGCTSAWSTFWVLRHWQAQRQSGPTGATPAHDAAEDRYVPQVPHDPSVTLKTRSQRRGRKRALGKGHPICMSCRRNNARSKHPQYPLLLQGPAETLRIAHPSPCCRPSDHVSFLHPLSDELVSQSHAWSP